MAVKTTITCDLTGKAIEDGDKFSVSENHIAKHGNDRSVEVTITIHEGVDVDRNALFTAIGNLALKRTRAKKIAAEPPAGDTAPASGKRSKAGENPTVEV